MKLCCTHCEPPKIKPVLPLNQYLGGFEDLFQGDDVFVRHSFQDGNFKLQHACTSCPCLPRAVSLRHHNTTHAKQRATQRNATRQSLPQHNTIHNNTTSNTNTHSTNSHKHTQTHINTNSHKHTQSHTHIACENHVGVYLAIHHAKIMHGVYAVFLLLR